MLSASSCCASNPLGSALATGDVRRQLALAEEAAAVQSRDPVGVARDVLDAQPHTLFEVAVLEDGACAIIEAAQASEHVRLVTDLHACLLEKLVHGARRERHHLLGGRHARDDEQAPAGRRAAARRERSDDTHTHTAPRSDTTATRLARDRVPARRRVGAGGDRGLARAVREEARRSRSAGLAAPTH